MARELPPIEGTVEMVSPDAPKVLIVDDDVTSLDLLQRGLTKTQGYEVRTAASARAALALAETSRFDIFLVDLRLPGEMSGIEMVRKLTDAYGPVTFVLVTGFADVPSTVEAMKIGAFTVLEKPVRLDDLGLVIERALSDAGRRVATEPAAPQPTCSADEADRHAQAGAAGRVGSNAVASWGEISPEAPLPLRVKRRFRHGELFALAESAIEANLSRTDLNLATVATLLHVSRWRLSRAFSGCRADYRACLRRARMRRAAQILGEGRASSIKEVAIAVGYLYSSDFTKHFKEHWGMTPTAFWATSSCRIRGSSNRS